MTIINEFIERYEKEFDFYQEAARVCSLMCEKNLENSGIRAIVSHRAKRPDRLRQKLEKRNEQKNYCSVEEIYADIVDLAGVRIALYFPGDQDEIQRLIDDLFIIQKTKKFPEEGKSVSSYSKRFNGYYATHYRVQLKEDKMNESEKRYKTAQIEIQIASVLMHAWSEVEHDLAYKPFSGQLSDGEYAILDELNGLVLSGEIALERLQNAVKERVSKQSVGFSNHYELSAFLYDLIKDKFPKTSNEPIMGRADVLLEFLKSANLDHPTEIKEYVTELDYNTEKRPITEQLIDRILAANSQLYSVYQKIRVSIDKRNPYSSSEEKMEFGTHTNAVGFFITCWSLFETTLMEIAHKKGISNRVYLTPAQLSHLKVIPEEMIAHVNTIRQIRNTLVHHSSKIDISKNDLVSHGKTLIEILRNIARESTDEDISSIVNKALSEFQFTSEFN
ncbi:GTP pyrophosphokinase [Bacillus cereus]|uniref:GTP pyrophosphokinase n=1 Tax=Bacillus cereus TaxID=1396 RepID=UPI000952E75D|nr:RelA/SpoT domain-containing protein [Bacillus cereus]OLR22283.1 hypothetical protein BLD50_29115 [Bacillus cereus]